MTNLTELKQSPTHEIAEFLIRTLGEEKVRALILWLQLKMKADRPIEK